MATSAAWDGHNVDPKTLTRFIMETSKDSQRGSDLSFILSSLSVACKVIANAVTMAGIQSLHALHGGANATGDDQKSLDVLSNDVMINALRSSRKVGAMVSEEDPEAMTFTDDFTAKGVKYALVFDPLDGSSNIECNVSVGTIFGVYECVDGQNPCAEDCMQPGTSMICAGYVLYSSACIMVLSTGLDSGVHSFTIDPTFGEFVESSQGPIVIPADGGKHIYSVNAGNSELWDLPTAEFVRWTKRQKDRYSLRYIGSMVADVHRTLLYGGIFMYPADFFNRKGKLRLIYECFPMAFLVEAAGGMASTGTERILDLKPTSIHERAPIFLGCKRDVKIVEGLYQRIPNLFGMHFSPLDQTSARTPVQHEDRLGAPSPLGGRTKVGMESRKPLRRNNSSRASSVEPPTKRGHWAISVATYTLLESFDGDDDHFEHTARKGETFTELCKMNDPKWVLCTSADGQRGLLPTRLLSAAGHDTPSETAIAPFAGNADNHEIDFEIGDTAISVRHCNDSRWCHVKNSRTGMAGIVPASIFRFAGGRKRFTGNDIVRHSKVVEVVPAHADAVTAAPQTFSATARYALTQTVYGESDNFELSGAKGAVFTSVRVMQDAAWVTAKDAEGKSGLLPAAHLELAPGGGVRQRTASDDFEGDTDSLEIVLAKGEAASGVRVLADARFSYAKNSTGEGGVVPTSLLTPAEAASYALVKHFSGDEDNFELSGRRGDTFHGVEPLSDEEWCSAIDDDGKRGVLPTRLLKKQLGASVLHFVAVKPFAAELEHHEVNFAVGDLALAVRRLDDRRWVYAKNATSGHSGLVPADVFNLPIMA